VTPDRRIIFVLFSLVFGLRVLYAAVFGANPEIISNPVTHDYLVASKIAAGAHWWSQPISPYAPGYQFMLAVLFRIGGAHYWLAILLQAVIGGITAFLLYRIGEKCLGRGAGLLSALWFSVYVHHMYFTSIVVRDVTTTMLFVFVCYLMILYTHRMRGAVWTGLAYSALIHFDPQYLYFFPLIALYFLLYATRHKILNLQFFFLFLGCVLVLLIPWTVRNQRVYGDAIPIGLETAHYVRPVKQLAGSLLDRSDAEKALSPPRADFGINTVEFWRVTRFKTKEVPDNVNLPVEPAWSLRHNLISIANYGLLLPFLLLGVWNAVRKKNRAGVLIAAAIAVYFLIRLFYGGSERLRLPVEPLIILLAFYAIVDLPGRIRQRRAAPETDA
jgi:4-amino-4-deoxy-L-arabinose transferase-like glycosyltransferase